MDFLYTTEQEAFRDELKQWLTENMKELPDWYGNRDLSGPHVDSKEYEDFAIWWHKKLFNAGFVGITWPKEYGGRGGTIMEQVIFYEEIAKHRAPGFTRRTGLCYWLEPIQRPESIEVSAIFSWT